MYSTISQSPLLVFIFTGRNKVVAKVMFLQVCVCPQGGGCLPQCMLGCQTPTGSRPPGTRQTPLGPCRPPPDQAPPWDQADPPRPGRPPQIRHSPGTRQTPPDQTDPPRTRQTPWDQADPPGSRLQHTVYERPVRILLECLLVILYICKNSKNYNLYPPDNIS